MLHFLKQIFGANSVVSASTSSQQTSAPRCKIGQTSHTRNPQGYSSSSGGVNWFQLAAENNLTSSDQITIYDPNGNPLQLGVKEEQGSGGEGTVYSFAGNSNLLIKIYKETTSRNPQKMNEKLERINDMLQIQACRQMNFLAWPLMPVMNSRKQVIGFVMRKCTGYSLRSLHAVSQIQKYFPSWNRSDLNMVALNYIKNLQTLAAHEILVNDFNPANFLVDENHNVSFIDCDSFQIPSRKGGVNITRTFFGTHVAPELLRNKQHLERPRTMQHVNFAAALTVFQILMCGLHPYAHCGGGMPEDNLLAGKCPLGKESGAELPTGWYNLLSYLPYSMMDCFIRMFKDGHSNPSVRPLLEEIEVELKKFLWVMERDKIRETLNPNMPKNKKKSETFKTHRKIPCLSP